jgi:uncharacterized protein YkwD
MRIAIPESHDSGCNFTVYRDKVGVGLTVLSSGTLRRVKALCILFLGVVSIATLFAAPRRPGQPDIRIPSLEHRVHDLINKTRVEHMLGLLVFDERLSAIARGHSRDMASRDFFGHTNPDGLDATARGKRAGFTCRKQVSARSFREGLGENLYQDNLYARIRTIGTTRSYDWNTSDNIAANSVRAWMNSQGHRHNILESVYTHTGIGIAIGDDDKVYVTQVFC